MKKVISLVCTLIFILLCAAGCSVGDRYNRERYYGVIRYLDEFNQTVVYIPGVGDMVIPESDGYCICHEDHKEVADYQPKVGDLVAITFRYEKSWDDNSVRIMEMYPAMFDRGAHLIEVLKEDISFSKDDYGYRLSFPLTPEIETAEIGDVLYFVQHGGENGRAYKKLYASGEIISKTDGIVTVKLTIHGDESKFLNFFCDMTIELIWQQ